MRYLITFTDQRAKPFFTDWFEPENNFVEGMIVFNLFGFKRMVDGKNWEDVELDHL